MSSPNTKDSLCKLIWRILRKFVAIRRNPDDLANFSEWIMSASNEKELMGILTSKLKHAKVIPVFKCDDETDPNN